MSKPRQPKTVQLGEIGESFCTLFFNQLGWGPVPTGRHDVGTDLFVQMRGHDLTDLGLMLGVQAKHGDSFFSRPGHVDGRRGWWFTEGADHHGEYWTDHHVPHIVILISDDTTTAVWAYLDTEHIQSTGVGIKVFVPDDQRLTKDHRDQWINWVMRSRRRMTHEGARWRFNASHLPADQRARYCLLVPRIVSPHPSRGTDVAFSWPEAISVIIEGTPERWSHFTGKHPDVPSPEDAHAHNDHGWRLAAAIYSWLTGGIHEPLQTLLTAESTPPHLRSAAAVCLALALEDQSRISDAVAALTSQHSETLSNSDKGWLDIHQARLLAEIGDHAGAIEAVNSANIHLGTGPRDDVAVEALRSAAIWLLFTLTDRTDRTDQSMTDVVTALDTTASWWRRYPMSTGLSRALDRVFKQWSQDPAVQIFEADTVHNDLYSAGLIARLSGLSAEWNAAAGTLAKADLSTGRTSDERLVESIDLLRRSGRHKDLQNTVRKVKRHGPAAVLPRLVRDVTPDTMTRTSSRADLTLVSQLGPYFPPDIASTWLGELIASLQPGGSLVNKVSTDGGFPTARLHAIAGLVDFADDDHVEAIVHHIATLPAQHAEVIAPAVDRLLRVLRLTSAQRTALGGRAVEINDDNNRVQWVLAGTCGRNSTTEALFRNALLQGDISAAAEIPLSAIQLDEATAIGDRCRQKLADIETETRRGSFSGYIHDYPAWYARLVTTFEGSADLDYLLSFLRSPQVLGSRKRHALKILSEEFADLDAGTQGKIRDVAETIVDVSNGARDTADPLEGPLGGAALELLFHTYPAASSGAATALARMLSGTKLHRADAADACARVNGYENLLVTLLADHDQDVRERAITGITRRLVTDPELWSIYGPILTTAVATGGELAVAAVLRNTQTDNSVFTGILEELTQHPSISVRATAMKRLHSN
ncbi:DUF4365 domain-containing protein [Nocardia asteroides]|uniref:DUF4365 domain-containing protein n=1 Tax=Nocardia asteroides NBRC 15531 TaxID=1110697 RepID=U5E401_NOCAS|nr:DUF4365 domain-containing protein [Nocardia asteroides]UGT50768.1 DUF4365 domain-containing protein [Nocardia asteroides]GAD83422.1 hypothetical protein NCAST_19_01240 [Nocardia asteroides NBRC 15531]